MNSRSSVNETNLVNFSTDIPTLNQLDAKDGLLSFPFDHIYACHSDTSEPSSTLQLEAQLDKEVEIATHCVVGEDKNLSPVSSSVSEISRLKERLDFAETLNIKLKDLLIFHLDLIQQQNELINKREKVFQAIKQENDTLKSKLSRKSGGNTPALSPVPSQTITSSEIKSDSESAPQIMLNSFPDLILPDSASNPFLFDSDLNKSKPFGQEPFDLGRTSETDVTNFLSADLGVSSLLDTNIGCEEFTMIESKRSFVKKDMKTESRPEPLYTVTSNSGNPVIQRIQRSKRRTSSSLGSLSRMSKSPVTKAEASDNKVFDDDKSYERFSVNKKSKMINTYGKSKSSATTPKRLTQFTGSLSDRLQLIDTTPTGEDPYQLGEADMREQSPIPKLMLQKTNHGRMKICTDTSAESTVTSRRLYSPVRDDTKANNDLKIDNRQYNMPSTYMHPSELKSDQPKSLLDLDPVLDLVKPEPDLDWPMYSSKQSGNETSLCDFSYGETPGNIESSLLPSLDSEEFRDLFSTGSPLNLDNLTADPDFSAAPVKIPADKSKKRAARTTSLIASNATGVEPEGTKRSADSKRGRKRALSTTGLKNIKRENAQKGAVAKPKLVKGKAACRGKKSPLPGMLTKIPYHTLVGDPDMSWYLGLDPDVKTEDVEPSENAASTVEVPRWREKPYASCYTLEGTENLDDKVFEKRHQKLEAEERRQLRWHMRRIREQRQVERLRQRQRDSWSSTSSSAPSPSTYTLWPQAQRDLRFIEITDSVPVMAFGDSLPALPESPFQLPWVRTSKAQKRSKRSKTLH